MEQDIEKYINEILLDSHLMALATSDEKGPWSSVLAFVSDEKFNIYWMSTPEARHSVSISQNNKVAISITKTSKPNEENKGVQMFGSVEKLGSEYPNLDSMYKEKESHLIYAPRHEVQGFLEVWYKFTPEYIEVTYEPAWAYEKKRYSIAF